MVGKHSLMEIRGEFTDEKFIKNQILEACWDHNLSIVNISEHSFYPHGYTCLVLIGESHLSIHTYPENETAYCDCFSCGSKDPEEILKSVASKLNSKIKSMKTIER